MPPPSLHFLFLSLFVPETGSYEAQAVLELTAPVSAEITGVNHHSQQDVFLI